jgi:hypothetical protein
MHDASLISCTRPYSARVLSQFISLGALSVLEKNKEAEFKSCVNLLYVLKYKILSVWCNFMSFLKPFRDSVEN